MEEKVIFYCERCGKTYSGDKGSKKSCPECNVEMYETQYLRDDWRSLSLEEKLEKKIEISKEIIRKKENAEETVEKQKITQAIIEKQTNARYVVLQVTLKEKLIGTAMSNIDELELVINTQAEKGYRLHSIAVENGGSKGLAGGDRLQAILVFEKEDK